MRDKDENDNEIKTSNSGGVRRRNKNFGVLRHQLILSTRQEKTRERKVLAKKMAVSVSVNMVTTFPLNHFFFYVVRYI